MKTIEEKAKEYCLIEGEDSENAYLSGHRDAQEFIPLEEEKPPYGEDILAQTHRGAIYFGKMKDGISGRPDFLQIDCSGDTVSINNIKSWRPIFYK